MDTQVEREILAAHADQLNAGLRGTAAYPPMNSAQLSSLSPLLHLAEWLSDALVRVDPSPAFVHQLGQELAEATAQRQLSMFERYRKAILVVAATIGSAVSLIGIVLLYFFRQRGTAEGTAT